jgi:hypothetical protein
MGAQRFECQSDTCYSTGYSYAPYHRLVIEFSDGVTRASNTFTAGVPTDGRERSCYHAAIRNWADWSPSLTECSGVK